MNTAKDKKRILTNPNTIGELKIFTDAFGDQLVKFKSSGNNPVQGVGAVTVLVFPHTADSLNVQVNGTYLKLYTYYGHVRVQTKISYKKITILWSHCACTPKPN